MFRNSAYIPRIRSELQIITTSIIYRTNQTARRTHPQSPQPDDYDPVKSAQGQMLVKGD